MKFVFGVVTALLAVAYPFAVYWGLLHWSLRGVSWSLVGLILLIAALRVRGANAVHWREVLVLPALVVGCLLVGLLVDDPRWLRAQPTLINAAFFARFASSLRGETSTVEHFARLRGAVLSPEKVRYCRNVTKAWCVFFVFNGSVAGALGLWGSLSTWALYSGLISYVLIALLATVEFLVRHAKFPASPSGPLGRAAVAVLGKRSNP